MKKKTQHSSKSLNPVHSAESPSLATSQQEVAGKNNETWKAEHVPGETQTALPPGKIDAPQEHIPLVQLTLSISQIEHDFKCEAMSSAGEQREYVALSDSHFIGLGRSQRCQWTMVTAPLIGVAKQQGKIKVNL